MKLLLQFHGRKSKSFLCKLLKYVTVCNIATSHFITFNNVADTKVWDFIYKMNGRQIITNICNVKYLTVQENTYLKRPENLHL